MKLIALDTETTSLKTSTAQILEIAAIVFDSVTGKTLGEFQDVIHHTSITSGDPYALAMNSDLLRQCADPDTSRSEFQVSKSFRNFLHFHFTGYRPHPVGFNVAAFDVPIILNQLQPGPSPFHHRSVELGTLLMAKHKRPGPMSSKEAFELYELGNQVHRALPDARAAVTLYMEATS